MDVLCQLLNSLCPTPTLIDSFPSPSPVLSVGPYLPKFREGTENRPGFDLAFQTAHRQTNKQRKGRQLGICSEVWTVSLIELWGTSSS